MNDETSSEAKGAEEHRELLARRLFLQSIGKWSGAAIAAAVFGGAWLAFPPETNAGAWVNRRAVAAMDGLIMPMGGAEIMTTVHRVVPLS